MTNRFDGVARFLWAAIIFIPLGMVAVAATLMLDTVRHAPLSITHISDPALPPEVQALEAASLPFAFDRDTRTAHVLYGAGDIEVLLEPNTTLSKLRTFGASPYSLSVVVSGGTGNDVGWSTVRGAEDIDLSALGSGWNDIQFGDEVPATKLRLRLTPTARADATGIPEFEFWGAGETMAIAAGPDVFDLLQDTPEIGEYRQIALEGTVSISARQPTETISFELPFAPADIRSAWLSYDLNGIHSWVAVRRAINGRAPEGGYVTLDDQGWSHQLEPISPEQLVHGENAITFGTLPGLERSYRIRAASLIIALDDGRSLILDPELRDDRAETGHQISSNNDEIVDVSLPLVSHRSLDDLILVFDQTPSGSLTISSHDPEGNTTLRGPFALTAGEEVGVEGLTYTIALDGLTGTHLELFFDDTQGRFALLEADASGSPVSNAQLPATIQMTWPENGEYYDRTAFMRGHVRPFDNGSGPAEVFVGGLPFEIQNGSFEVAISKDQAGFMDDTDDAPWSVEVAALYPDGEAVTQTIILNARVFADGLSTYTPEVMTQTFTPGVERSVEHEGAMLTVMADALAQPTEIQMSALTDVDMPKLDPGLVNVTMGPRHGYRMLPHMTFRANVELRLPYDKEMLPAGYTEDDIRVFFFDEELGRWTALTDTSVDMKERRVHAKSDHFTDFIAGVVVAPESPQTASFNPTQLKDMKVADPSARINLIAAPQGTNSGDAGLSYPIELPAGRQGVAPQIGLQYNSAAGNGWMGVGWNLSMQEVTIDTRWGVPRYDATQETETYLWSGQQLTPVAHRGALVPREADRVFHTRVEGSFNRIIRHGDTPANYWWEVTDKMGTRYAYGGNLDTGAQDASSVLTDDQGHVFKWALNEVRDSNGNRITYDHVTVNDVGLASGSVMGRQLYCAAIQYTGHTSNGTGPFEVRFLRDRDLGGTTRRDTIIDGRGGFKMVTADLLRRIEVTYNGIQVRAYEFDYAEGAFYKQLLQSVTQLDAQDQPFNTHTFDYFDDARDGETYRGFGTATQWSQTGGDDNVTLDAFLGDIEASSISGTEADGSSFHFHGGIAPGPSKFLSVGFKYGRSRSDMTGRLMLLDLNGDGLNDKVFVANDNRVFWRRNESGPDGSELFATPILIGDLNTILRERSTTTSKGVEVFLGASLGVNDADTVTTTSVYFTDANGDGLPDLNLDGVILFNVLDNAGTPTFTADSSVSAYPIGPGAVDGAAVAIDFADLLDDLINSAPLVDNLRVWTAPYTGTVDVSGAIQLIADTSPERADYTTADGVRATVELNGVQLLIVNIPGTDYVARPTNLSTVNVAKGDRLYFRLQSNFDGRFDQVDWAPVVDYTSLPVALDANGLSLTSYDAAADFTLFTNGETQIVATFNGQLQLEGVLAKTVTTTDDVTVTVRKTSRDLSDVLTTTVLGTQTVPWDVIGTVDLTTLIGGAVTVQKTETTQVEVGVDTNGDPIFETEISQWADQIEVAITTASPIDLAALSWTTDPVSYYTVITDPGQSVTDINGEFATLQSLAPAATIFSNSDQLTPLQAWISTVNGVVDIDPAITANNPGLDSMLWLTVKSANQLIAKEELVIVGGVVTVPPLSFSAVLGERYYIEVSGADPGILSDVTVTGATVTLPDLTTVAAPIGANGAGDTLIVSQPYRAWSTFGYDGNKARADQPIALSDADLAVPTAAELAAQQAAVQAAADSGDPAQIDAIIAMFSPKVFGFLPDVSLARWTTIDDGVWTTSSGASSSRLGDDFPSVPDPTVFAGAQAVSRIARTDNDGLTAGLLFVSGAKTDTDTVSILDFLDLNGDRFPDVVSANRMVQYSPMIGGLEATAMTIAGMETAVRTSSGESSSFGIGGTFPIQIPSGSGALSPNGTGRDPGDSGTQMASLGVSGNYAEGTSDVGYDLRDMNADGLPDIVRQGGTLDVAFNLGYRFAAFETFGAAAIDVQINDGEYSSLGGGLSIGFNDGIYGFAGSLNRSETENKANESLLDINGDGLIDRVRAGDSSGVLHVRLNSGSGFEDEINWPTGTTNAGLADSLSISDSVGGYVTFAPGFFIHLILNPGFDVSESMSRAAVAIQDMDGDGFPEYLTSSDSDDLRVSLDTIERTNMLRQVNRPLGSTVTLAYVRSGNTIDQPQNKWVLARVEVNDGFAGDGTDILATNFTYEDGYWDREEREFFGYARVIEDHMNVDAVGGEAIYRTITRDFLNDTYYEKGLLEASTTADAAGNLFVETANTYDFVDIATGTTISQPDSLTATVFPQLVRTDNQFYEGQAVAGKATFMTFAYDALGNVITYFDAANLDTTADDVTSQIGYHADLPNYIVGKANSVVVTGQGGSGPGGAYRNRVAVFQTGTGNLLQLQSILETGATATTDMTYDGFGNLINVTGPANATGQRYALSYVFDSEVDTYVTGITDSFGYTSAASYDVRFSELLSTTDLNGQPMTYVLDDVGRVVSVTGPYQAGSGFDTISFAYNPRLDVPGDDQFPDVDVSWALTQHIDVYRNIADPIETALFIDGLGRVLQTKKDAAIYEAGSVTDRMVASGRITFDFLGRQTEQYYPVEEALGNQGILNATYDSVAPTLTDYDILDRPVRVTIPDGTSTQMVYDFGADRSGTQQFRTLFIDAEGNRRETFADVRRLMTSVKEINPVGGQPTIWTSYEYDPLRQITNVTDDQGNLTLAGYDNFGRMTVLENPDTGRTTYGFDLASNLVTKQTANLAADGTVISYGYEFNRLASVTYPEFTDNNVTYVYGAPGAANNRANRIASVTSEAGTEERFYGPLGEMIQQTWTVASDTPFNDPFDLPEIYTTLWTYDTWNRVHEMTYPDGEVLTNRYDSGGKLDNITGEKIGFDYNYLDLMGYDKFGQRNFMRAGNGVETTYAYVPTTRRLDALQTSNQLRTFMDMSYVYDDVGNIIRQGNAATVLDDDEIGGATDYTYTYDNLYRLTNATGFWGKSPEEWETFDLDMTYDTIHNIVGKDQRHFERKPDDAKIVEGTTYDWTYSYTGPQPHAPTNIGLRDFSYDLNGNQTGWVRTDTGSLRGVLWDEENRIQAIHEDDGTIDFTDDNAAKYKYDDAGQRIVKYDGLDGFENVYPNQFWTVRDRDTIFKHVFAGGTRLVSKRALFESDPPQNQCDLTAWGWETGVGSGLCQPIENSNSVAELEQYFYHPDHLGSSSYMTNVEGLAYQHLAYFPFGEIWVQEFETILGTEYYFTGKEFDNDTQLSYFGARYYDPRTSVWQSPDPILASYMGGEINNGVFDPLNLNLFAYSHQRPIVMFDPDGLAGMSSAALYGTTCDSECMKTGGSFVLDFVPIIGDVKGFVEAETAGDYVWATVGLVPVVGDIAGKVGKGIGRAFRGTCSFHGDTLVLTADGMMPISQIVPGTLVWSRDPATGEMGLKPVLAQYSNPYEETVYVSIRDAENGEEQVIISNRIHPFFVQREAVDGPTSISQSVQPSSEGHVYRGPIPKGFWIDAADLQPGDRLLNDDQSWAVVVDVEVREQRLEAYNLTIEQFETYFVGATLDVDAVWVHNNCAQRIADIQGANRPNAQDSGLQAIYNQVFRVQDVNPGGTAGELLREVAAGGDLTHLTKAKERITNIRNYLTSPAASDLSRLDRQGAERVLADLRYAVRVAEGIE